jgi:hypothetical protein
MAKEKQFYRPFEEAREFAQGLGLRSWTEWYAWCRSNEPPADIPAAPNRTTKGRRVECHHQRKATSGVSSKRLWLTPVI